MRLALNPRRRPFAAVAVVAWLALVAGLLVPQVREAEEAAATQECPTGTRPASEIEEVIAPDRAAQLPPQYRGFQEFEPQDVLGKVTCVRLDGPESFQEMALRDREYSAARTAPFSTVAAGANLAAAREREQMIAQPADVPGADGSYEPYGQGPLIFDDPRWNGGQIAELGLVDATGRIDDYTYDAATGQLFAAIGTGGIWRSMDLGDSWESISDSLPAAVVGAVTYSSAGGPEGTILTITGEHTFGGNAYTGIGAWYSRDGGETWQQSGGVPEGALGFTIEVDPTDPNTVYAGTQNGLFRSTDAGETYTNVVLPTGDECAGVVDDPVNCNFANMVTDVVIKAPGGVGEDTEGGTVVAAVGWRAGMRQNPPREGETEGQVQSPNNGIYRSDTGEPGSFERLDGLDSAVGGKPRIGRIEMGPTVGDEQDHDYLYAVVEDAVLFNGGFPIGDAPIEEPEVQDPVIGLPISANTTVLNGIFVSPDFGESWIQLESQEQLAATCPTNGSALCIPGLVNPGVQAWYDMWIEPDPSVQVGGVPSRVVFGLEEVWQNVRGVAAEDQGAEQPVDNESVTFEVFGRYFSGSTCALGLVPLVAGQCATSRPPSGTTTPHPDQHDGIFITTETGTALLIGQDGGMSRQDVGPNDEFNNGEWQLDQDNGLQTLLPYSAVIANDGVAYAGLQDNGHLKVIPDEGFAQYSVFGGDGTFAAVDYEDSDYAFESVQGGVLNVTTDGGLTWRNVEAPAEGKRFVNPFVMDETNSDHIATGGRQINETLAGPRVTSGNGDNEGADTDWVTVFDLGVAGSQEEAPSTDANVDVNNGMSAIDTRGDVTYVGFCGACDVLNAQVPFRSGIATNLAGTDGELPQAASPAGWGFVPAEGLPNRFINNVTIDPLDETGRTVYVALGGYSRRWVPPGSVQDVNAEVGEGHIFKSTDAGRTFTDISGNLPDIPATWIEPRGEQLIVGTDNGVYLSSDTAGGDYAVLGGDRLPAVPISSLQLKGDDPNFLLVGTYGRSLQAYTFPEESPGDGSGGGGGLGEVPAQVEIRRVAGTDRVQTSIETSQELFADGSTDSVVLSRGDDYADALAGAPFARSVNAPVLLTPSNDLGDGVADEIDRLGATTAYLLGGNEAIEPAVERQLEDQGLTIVRIGGTNRYDTARLIAFELGGTDVYIAEGFDDDPARGWPDALAAAPVAAAQGRPILLVDTNGLPGETADAIETLGAQTAVVLGGPMAVSEATATDVADLGVQVERVGGATRFETSALLSGFAERTGLTFANTWLARGGNWPDALTSGPTVAASGGILLLVGDTNLDESPPTRDLLEERVCDIDVLRILGGVEAIAGTVEQQARDLVAVATCAAVPGTGSGGGGTGGPGAPTPDPDPAPTPDPEPVPTGEPFAGPFGFEEDEEGFSVEPGQSFEGTPGNPATSWERIEPGAQASTTSFGVVPYFDLSGTILVSPELTSPGGLTFLSWDQSFDIEGAGFDEVAVEFSSDGEEWTTLVNLGGTSPDFPEFNREQVSFEAPAGPLFVRYRFFSDQICSSVGTPACARPDGYEGVRIDNIALAR